jgi:hypothetical protein
LFIVHCIKSTYVHLYILEIGFVFSNEPIISYVRIRSFSLLGQIFSRFQLPVVRSSLFIVHSWLLVIGKLLLINDLCLLALSFC